jgi:hypothetical protein
MTVKDAIVKTLEDFGTPKDSTEITEHILKKEYYKFDAERPSNTVAAQCSGLIRRGDTRVKRIKQKGSYLYYLTKNESSIEIDKLTSTEIKANESDFDERDLHMLLSTYLKSISTYSKTIYHEQSNRNDDKQIWTHPDMVGIYLLNLQNKISQAFLKTINKNDIFKISSYELKKEINNDYELKKAYFQAVSNSSWANYGYLVAFEISSNLKDEIERLNESFGIGVIELNANPYQSKVLFQAKYHALDFKTIDKLCKINDLFGKFIEQIEKLLTAEERYYKVTEKELNDFCDGYLKSDADVKEYCNKKNIPIEESQENMF